GRQRRQARSSRQAGPHRARHRTRRRHRRTPARPAHDSPGREREDRVAAARADGAEMTRHEWRVAAMAALAGLTIAAASLTAQQKAKTLSDGVYSADQAQRGKAGFDGVCARCHGAQLMGSQGNGPTLKGAAFLAHWDKDTLGSLWVKIRDTMPQGTPGTLTDEV